MRDYIPERDVIINVTIGVIVVCAFAVLIAIILSSCSVIYRPEVVKPTPTSAPEEEFVVNLPVVYKDYPKVVLATYIEALRPDDPRLKWAKPNGIIGTGINFASYNWDHLDKIFATLEEQGFRYTIQFKNVPEEWRIYPDKECSPPKPEHYDDFANLVIDGLNRYDPYGISIWNEPEPTPQELGDGWAHYIGCWGDIDKPYMGGEDYGMFLSHIYPIIKKAHPDITIAGGELIFAIHNERDRLFAKGVAKYGMFDEFSFHSYPAWPSNGHDYPFMQADFAKSITDKPLQLSETSYACDDAYFTCSDTGYEEEQAKYLKHILDGAKEHGIVFIRWYTLARNGWRNTDLVYIEPKPAYYIYLEH